MSDRIALDAYYTPDAVAEACVHSLGAMRWVRSSLEPSSGGGAFVRAVRKLHPGISVQTCDIDSEAPGRGDSHWVGDFAEFTHPEPFDLIIGNPPFSHAEQHTRHALSLVNRREGLVAFLLRLAFLESLDRLPFWREFPPSSLAVIVPRPSFTGGGSDNSAYGFFAWYWLNRKLMPHIGRQAVNWIQWRAATRELRSPTPPRQGALF